MKETYPLWRRRCSGEISPMNSNLPNLSLSPEANSVHTNTLFSRTDRETGATVILVFDCNISQKLQVTFILRISGQKSKDTTLLRSYNKTNKVRSSKESSQMYLQGTFIKQ